ncbi:MAG TPA: hypothetical protein PLS03_04960 [Terrimicrobiaceae bacterium]|nr:hypothetical protein [Terrimicrobiaceae bacterium]
MNLRPLIFAAVVWSGLSSAPAGFFQIDSVRLQKREPRDMIGVWSFTTSGKHLRPDQFQPCLEVTARAQEAVRSDQLIAKAYFFDREGKLIADCRRPAKSGAMSDKNHFEMPVIFPRNQTSRFFFQIPPNVQGGDWTAVVVFGDRNEAVSACYPSTASDFRLNYPERKLVHRGTLNPTARKPAMDPLIEHVVRTNNPAMPQITLFLRPPKGVTDPSEIRGVLAICLLASGVDVMKRQLQQDELPGDERGAFGFANTHKLAILAWGSRRLWNPGLNHDELARDQAREMDRSFDTVAAAWERGVGELCEKYGLPNRNFLLRGQSGAAQWAQRLCLRKPDAFLAVHLHIPSSFDKPLPGAAKVLWCLTTGERESGYERSKRFVAECQSLGYPIVYKAIVGLGHESSQGATDLGFAFFKYALTQRDAREALDRKSQSALRADEGAARIEPWPDAFRHPPFVGDMVNQEVFPAQDVGLIPGPFRISLPNEEIARRWEDCR